MRPFQTSLSITTLEIRYYIENENSVKYCQNSFRFFGQMCGKWFQMIKVIEYRNWVQTETKKLDSCCLPL